MCEVLTYSPINVVIGKAKDNIYLEKSIVGNKWPHLQLRQVRMSALLSTEPLPAVVIVRGSRQAGQVGE